MFHKRIPILLLAAYFLLTLSSSFSLAAEEELPAPIGDIYVQDFANILSPSEKQQLVGLGRAVENKTGAQIAVLTIDTTGDMEMPEYANHAFRSYGIGSKERDDGILLVLAVKDRSIRIEVGYGLEGLIPDGKAGRILDNNALPFLEKGQHNAAVINTYKTLANEVTGEITQEEPAQQPQGSSIPTWIIIIIVVGVIILDFTFFGGTLSYFLLAILSRGGGGGGGPRGGGGGSSGGGGAGRSW